jgi:type II secretory pathway pseudopilin PulG
MARIRGRRDDGYAMAALLVTLAVIGVMIGMALPVWRTVAQREREEELIFRGRQYARAIQLYQRKFANAYPASIDVLVDQRFLRKKYKDPMTKSGEFDIISQAALAQRRAAAAAAAGRGGGAGSQTTEAGRGAPAAPAPMTPSAFGSQVAGPQGGIVGVASKSKDKSLRIYDGRTAYNEWQFIWAPAATRTGPAGSVGPGGRFGQPGQGQPGGAPGMPRGRGPGGAGSPYSRPPG